MLRATFLAGTCLAMLGTCAQNMVTGEFWVDSDPGWGLGSPISGMPAQPDVPAQQFAVPTTDLDPGMHIIGIRTKDANGHWGLTNTTPVSINPPPQMADIVRTVYFWNTDAGWISGTDADIDGDPSVNGTVITSLAGTLPGINLLFVRSQDANGHWSLTNTLPVYVDVPDADAPIARTEYFLNTDPGWGLGTDAALAGQPDMNGVVSASINDAGPGINILYARSKDAHGHWSLTNAVPLHAEAASNGDIVAAESFWDMDPGFSSGFPVPDWTPGADVSSIFNLVVPETLLANSYHQLFVRTRDSHGHWSLTNWKMDSVYVEFNTSLTHLSTAAGISVFPNPFTEGFTVLPTNAQPLRLILYDPQGKLIHDEILNTTKRIDLSGLSNGAYTAFFWKDTERIHRVTLVKQ